MKPFNFFLFAFLCLSNPNAWGQSTSYSPRIGYLHPAGGQRSEVFKITAGGQFLKGVDAVYISGEGVHASVVEYVPPIQRLKNEQLQELMRRFKELREKRLAESNEGESFPRQSKRPFGGKFKKASSKVESATMMMEVVTLPDHPLIRDLESKSLKELDYLAKQLMDLKKKQMNTQIAESVFIEVTIDANASPGDRELRLQTPNGLSNPLRFQVGQQPEFNEKEPNDPEDPDAPVHDLPLVINGQILPKDVDYFRFKARQGQKLVIDGQARRLIPYLADAVPGWFQAVLVLYDADGKQLAIADDYRFDPDPVLFYEVPKDGEYKLEIRDALYRGREDFVYRITVGESPFITGMSPLGGRSGDSATATLTGWNLPWKKVKLDTKANAGSVREAACPSDEWISNRVLYAVDSLPECAEAETNDSSAEAQSVDLPKILNGKIGRAGDVDVFKFNGRSGEKIVLEVEARRLCSPLDSLLRLTDSTGKEIAVNDDCDDKGTGLLTHQADSYLLVTLPSDGVFYATLSDTQSHGGEGYGYRLRISAPQLGFAVIATPSSIGFRAGRTAVISVTALRRDGFDGDIELFLKDAPEGFILDGKKIPKGKDRIRMTVTAPRKPLDAPIALQMEARAMIGDQTDSLRVIPAEDMMQAFAYRHLVPSQELLVSVVASKYNLASVELDEDGPVKIPVGGEAEVRFTTGKRSMLKNIQLELSDPPKGVMLEDFEITDSGAALLLKVDADEVKAGFADNLIVEAFTESAKKGEKTPTQGKRFSVGVLPAIPIEVVQQ